MAARARSVTPMPEGAKPSEYFAGDEPPHDEKKLSVNAAIASAPSGAQQAQATEKASPPEAQQPAQQSRPARQSRSAPQTQPAEPEQQQNSDQNTDPVPSGGPLF